MSTALAPRCLGSAIRTTLPFAALFLLAAAASPASAASAQERYGYYRIVEGTSELLGWKDYARAHAASVIRDVLERNRNP